MIPSKNAGAWFGRPLWLLMVVLWLSASMSGAQVGQDAAGETDVASKDAVPSIVITGLRVEPSPPPPDTLCRLWVTLRNDGEQAASLLHFRLLLNGQVVRTYEDDTFVASLPAKQEREIRLFNFWSSETGRPAVQGGRLDVELILEEASWVAVEESAAADDGETTWTPTGPVAGLPSSRRRVFGDQAP